MVPTATATTTRGFRSYHSRAYAVGTQTNFGALAIAFLRAKKSFLGLRGFVNGALSEPFVRQDMRGQRIEVVVSKPEAKAEASKIMTVDCQHGSPHFWYVVRTWERSESSTVTTAIRAGHADTWEDLHAIKAAEAVPDAAVMVDSGCALGCGSISPVRGILRVRLFRGRNVVETLWNRLVPSKGDAKSKDMEATRE